MSHRAIPLFLSLILVACFTTLQAQKEELPLDDQLKRNSEPWLIKIGMITGKKPPKLKFGEFSTLERSGAAGANFEMSLINGRKDTVYVKGLNEKESDKNPNDISVYINTSIDTEELWILMMSRPTLESQEIALSSMIMTNGFSEITFEMIMGDMKGDVIETAVKGIQILIDEMPIAVMQYDSGTSFSYKKYIWISNRADPQLQLVAAGVFSALLEIGDYFSKTVIVE